MISVQIDNDEITGRLDRVLSLYDDPTKVMREITGVLADASEEQFEAEGRPGWRQLAKSTIAGRIRKDTWPGKILQVSGGLASSVTTRATRTTAAIGSNKVYAAIQQLGGKAGRGRRVTIPARPYLVFGSSEQEETLDILQRHTNRSLNKKL
jgi:phage virion morphogenesis protein